MKKTSILVIMFLALFCVSGWAAATITIDRVPNYFSGSGGEFNIASYDAATYGLYAPVALVNNRYGKLGFESFCLEYDEYVSIPGVYTATLNPLNQAWNGGVNTNLGDTISRGTVFLYEEFAEGTLAGYNYTPGAGRIASAADLQNTIWWLEDEGLALPNTFQALLIAQFGSLINAKKDLLPNSHVGVLNLTSTDSHGNTILNQDELVLVPEPMTLVFLGTGLLALGLVGLRRKFPK
jgi:hypothetical protein